MLVFVSLKLLGALTWDFIHHKMCLPTYSAKVSDIRKVIGVPGPRATRCLGHGDLSGKTPWTQNRSSRS